MKNLTSFEILTRTIFVIAFICALAEISIIAYGFNLLVNRDSKPFKVVHEVQFIQDGTNAVMEIKK